MELRVFSKNKTDVVKDMLDGERSPAFPASALQTDPCCCAYLDKEAAAKLDMKRTKQILAPLSGPAISLENLSDPAFAKKMVGDGAAVDPIDEVLVAPLSGIVSSLHPSLHAITITDPDGLEILIHIGLDTVMLKGRGFKPLVKENDNVVAGQPLIEFDPLVLLEAKSMQTMVIAANRDEWPVISRSSGFLKAGKDVLFEVSGFVRAGREQGEPGDDSLAIHSPIITVVNSHGFHARPAAMLSELARRFTSTIEILAGDKTANAKSVVSLIGADIRCNTEITLKALGDDATEALEILTESIRQGLGEEVTSQVAVQVAQPLKTKAEVVGTGVVEPLEPGTPISLAGVQAAPGYAAGEVYLWVKEDIEVPEKGGDFASEKNRLHAGIEKACEQISDLIARADAKNEVEVKTVFSVHLALLDDPNLMAMALGHLHAGKSAPFAWKYTITAHKIIFAKLNNELLADRVRDLEDVGRRVLSLLLGKHDQAPLPQLGDGVIIVAEDLTPSDVANLDISKVKGICTAFGGPTSHVAILSATMGIPALVSLGMQSVTVENGANIILDADNKNVLFYASDKEVETAKKTILARKKQWQERLQAAQAPVTTKDNVHIDVLVNVRDIDSLQLESSVGADGVGLLRSEFLFLGQQTAPGEEEQLEKYQRVADSLHGRPITYRTLDAGGDKPMVFLPLPHETNPALGLRGIRSSFFDKTLFRTQLRAILRVKPPQQRNILLPMITFLDEVLTAKQIIEEERSHLGAEPVEVGIMIEVPAAAVMADVLAQHVDFLSIGTNDLTQYTLAMDREHPEFSSRMDALHPAVLRLIKLTTDGASAHGKPVCVCGAVASDHAAIPVLIGLGVTKLSTTALALPDIKNMVRRLDSSKCREIAERALKMASAEEVRNFLATARFD
ncbi:MAG: phosphoenolpyruvate--protein phosphotransferase [Desulfuromonadaceae bacterium]|nr:phosphoenolpyruvate--protein phosphotransferase [Desulfuromonas sp.]MDY0185119.1 phosphoenolpyruvate--protein phosphotransferase [Desulfuromonadaceae bacterium]